MTEKQNQNKKYLLPIGLSVLSLVIGFGLGILYQQNHLKSTFSNRSGQFQQIGGNMTGGNRNNPSGQGQGNGGTGLRNGSGSGAVFGEITKIDDSSITVKTTDGSSKIVLISDSTVFNQATTASKDDLKVGTQIRASGTTDSNTGSVTGQTIEINPAMSNQLPPQQ